MQVSLTPVSKKDIHLLETVLLVKTIFRPDVIEMIKDPAERVTWLDSLAVAAGAFARRQAGMSIPEIAEELGRSEATIRKHLNQETKAGKLVAETLEELRKAGGKVEFEVIDALEYKAKVSKVKEELSKALEEVKDALNKIEDALNSL
ncbi:NEQ534 [Nanoarchaeum equitans Kin4-M]|uniref:NEQ534 n=1 Tax=Nanoarchaeum equitans (strain Kin4-M) TaxID=228908 RepID=Q74MV6_NANEQ|nr:NEQ534 [Nanoarchaeum equitans Kin4-M]